MVKDSRHMGERIRAARERLGVDRAGLAALLSVTRQAVVYWETGKRRPGHTTLPLLADVLQVTLDWLLLPEETQTTPPPINQHPTLIMWVNELQKLHQERSSVQKQIEKLQKRLKEIDRQIFAFPMPNLPAVHTEKKVPVPPESKEEPEP